MSYSRLSPSTFSPSSSSLRTFSRRESHSTHTRTLCSCTEIVRRHLWSRYPGHRVVTELAPSSVWADHADTISIPYSGTGALKTDFTRTGERTKQGALQDGKNSVVRYLKNNFYGASRSHFPATLLLTVLAPCLDGSKQDAYDLLTGEWSATASNVHKLSQAIVDQRSLEMRAVSPDRLS